MDILQETDLKIFLSKEQINRVSELLSNHIGDFEIKRFNYTRFPKNHEASFLYNGSTIEIKEWNGYKAQMSFIGYEVEL